VDVSAKQTGPGLPLAVLKNLGRWRKQYGSIFYLPDHQVVFRALKRGEVVRYHQNAVHDPLWAQIHAFKACVVYPEDWDGFAQKISVRQLGTMFKVLWESSGFGDNRSFADDLNQMRVTVQQRDHGVTRMICTAFPSYTPDDVDEMARDRILYLLAQAEFMLGRTLDGQPFEEMLQALEAHVLKESMKNQKRSRFFDWEHDLRELREAD